MNKRKKAAPTPENAMGEDKDILLDELLAAIEADGDLSQEEYNHLTLRALRVMIRSIRRVENNTISAIFAHNPTKAIAVTVIAFVLLHEFSTYVNIGVILSAMAKWLGVPIN